MNLRKWIIGGVAVAALGWMATPAEARPWRGYYGRPAVRAYYGPSYGYGYRYPGYYGRGYYGGYGGYYGRGFYGPGVGIGIGLGSPGFYRW